MDAGYHEVQFNASGLAFGATRPRPDHRSERTSPPQYEEHRRASCHIRRDAQALAFAVSLISDGHATLLLRRACSAVSASLPHLPDPSLCCLVFPCTSRNRKQACQSHTKDHRSFRYHYLQTRSRICLSSAIDTATSRQIAGQFSSNRTVHRTL
jgi:hypothetical protein